MKIYHNPRCSKSRQGLSILKDAQVEFEVIEYLKEPLSFDEIKSLIEKLKISPADLIRKNEAAWKENFKGKELSDKELIEAMVSYPKLIERPIVVRNNKAVIGRPPEKIHTLL